MSLVVWIGGSVLLVLLIIMFFVKWDNGYCDDWSDGGYVLVLFFVVLFFVLAWGCFGNWKEKKVRIYPDIEYNEETRLVKVKCKYDNLTYTGGLNKSYLNSEFDETFTKDTKWFIEESFNLYRNPFSLKGSLLREIQILYFLSSLKSVWLKPAI